MPFQGTHRIEFLPRDVGMPAPLAAAAPIDDPESSDVRLQSSLQAFLGSIVRLADARAGAVRSIDPERGQMRLLASIGLPPEVLECERLVGDCGVCGAAMKEDMASVEQDAIHIAESIARCQRLGGANGQAPRYAGSVAVPLSFRGRTVGVFTLFFVSVDTMRAEVLPLLRPLGHLLGLTLENARLERERLDASLLTERQSMAAEIHDSLAQSLSFMRMRMPLLRDAIGSRKTEPALQYCEDVSDELATTNRRLRELITHFRAGMDSHGLERALEQLSASFHERTGIDFVLDSRLERGLGLAADREVQAFHIVREALANIHKHSHARHVRVALDRERDEVLICVEDDGRGLPEDVVSSFRAGGAAPGGASCGLQIMRDRARAIGGSIDIENIGSGGARVRLRMSAQAEPGRTEAVDG